MNTYWIFWNRTNYPWTIVDELKQTIAVSRVYIKVPCVTIEDESVIPGIRAFIKVQGELRQVPLSDRVFEIVQGR